MSIFEELAATVRYIEALESTRLRIGPDWEARCRSEIAMCRREIKFLQRAIKRMDKA